AALLAAEKCLFELVRDRDPEVRANAIKLLGDWHPFSTTIPHPSTDTAREGARKLLADPEPRVRYFAALAYGHIGPVPQAITPGSEQAFFAPLVDLLKSDNDTDPYIRHAAVFGLTEAIRNPADLWNVWTQARAKYDVP